MNQSGTFVFAMTVTACLTFAGRMVIGSGGADVRPLAKSLGAATLNECRVTGRIESRPQGVYAVFYLENPTTTDKEIRFNYLATCTPAMSPFSRMIALPEAVKKGTVERRLNSGNTTEEILLKETAPVASDLTRTNGHPELMATGAVIKAVMETTPEIWSLVVAREEIKGIRGWGAVNPAAFDAPLSLDKGEVVIAITAREKKSP
jgi:hypothetical protein